MFLKFKMGDTTFTEQVESYSVTKRNEKQEDGATITMFDVEYGGKSITLHPAQYTDLFVMNDNGKTIDSICCRTTYSKEAADKLFKQHLNPNKKTKKAIKEKPTADVYNDFSELEKECAKFKKRVL